MKIEQDDDVINDIVGDAIIKLDINDETIGGDDNDQEEIVVIQKREIEAQNTHIGVVEAIDVLKAYMEQNNIPKEHKQALERLNYGTQEHHIDNQFCLLNHKILSAT